MTARIGEDAAKCPPRITTVSALGFREEKAAAAKDPE
jgi:hypothetical protein